MPPSQICTCPSPCFIKEDEEERCFYCGKPRFAKDRTHARQKGASSRPIKSRRARPEAPQQSKLHPDPDFVAAAVAAARDALGGDGFGSIPDTIVDPYIPAKKLWDRLKAEVPELESDEDVRKSFAQLLMQWVGGQFATAFADIARGAISIFASPPEQLKAAIKSSAMEVDDIYKTLGQAVALRLQADRLRRELHLAPDWPAEDAILLGPGHVVPPTTGNLLPDEAKATLADRIGPLLFGRIPLRLDDPRTIQAAKDNVHELIAKFFQQNKPLNHMLRHNGPTYVNTKDGKTLEFADPELALYHAIQEELPDYLSQPLPDTPTPRRVMIQRFIDARERQRSWKQITPLIVAVRRKRRGRPRKKN